MNKIWRRARVGKFAGRKRRPVFVNSRSRKAFAVDCVSIVAGKSCGASRLFRLLPPLTCSIFLDGNREDRQFCVRAPSAPISVYRPRGGGKLRTTEFGAIR